MPKEVVVAVGSDADLVIWDEGERTVRNAALHHDVDYTPYEGQRLRAWPALTLVGGAQAAVAQAKSWPTKPIRVIVNYPPGGAAALLGVRAWWRELERRRQLSVPPPAKHLQRPVIRIVPK